MEDWHHGTGRTFGTEWNRVKSGAAISIGVNRGQMFSGGRKRRKDSKVLAGSQVCATNNKLYDISSMWWTLFESSPAD